MVLPPQMSSFFLVFHYTEIHFDFNLESGWCDLVASYQISRRILKAGLSFSPVIGFVLGLTKSYGEAVALLRICAPGN